MTEYSRKLGKAVEKLIVELKGINIAIAELERREAESQGKVGAKSEALFEVKRKLRRRES